MPTPVIVLIAIALAVDLTLLVVVLVLRARGVTIYPRTKFGPALVFDSTDDDGTPIRLLNVNGKFQSVCYPSLAFDTMIL
jgi:spermidine synthase